MLRARGPEGEPDQHELHRQARPLAPPFATYLTLQRGLSYEREYAAWCRWAAKYVREHAGPNADGRAQ